MNQQKVFIAVILGTVLIGSIFLVPPLFKSSVERDALVEEIIPVKEPLETEVLSDKSSIEEVASKASDAKETTERLTEATEKERAQEEHEVPSLDDDNKVNGTTSPSVFFDLPITQSVCESLSQNSFFYWNPKSQVVTLEKKLRREGDIVNADLLRKISCRPQAAWVTQSDKEAMKVLVEELTKAAAVVEQVPVLTLYNGAQGNSIIWRFGNEGQEYLNWMEAVAEGINNREAWIILEPDSIGMSGSYNESDRAIRHNELKRAIRILKTGAPNVRVYLDAANSGWWEADFISELLTGADVFSADGFALNIANFHSLENEIHRGEEISEHLGGGVHFVIDTSRNGNGSEGGWCNLPDMALGVPPTTETGHELIDAFLWIKPPGESDGDCNGGPAAGKFWLQYALDLARNAAQ